MILIHFNIIVPSKGSDFIFFDFHLVFIPKYCNRFLFLHRTRSTKFIFFYLMRLKKLLKLHLNIASASQYIFNEAI